MKSVLAQTEARMQCTRQELLGGILWVALVAENGVLQISGFKLWLSGPLHSGPGKHKPHLPEHVRTLKGCRPQGGLKSPGDLTLYPAHWCSAGSTAPAHSQDKH